MVSTFQIFFIIAFLHCLQSGEVSGTKKQAKKREKARISDLLNTVRKVSESKLDTGTEIHSVLKKLLTTDSNEKFDELPSIQLANIILDGISEMDDRTSGGAWNGISLTGGGLINNETKVEKIILLAQVTFPNITLKDLDTKMTARISYEGPVTYIVMKSGRLRLRLKLIAGGVAGMTDSLVQIEQKKKKSWKNAFRFVNVLRTMAHYKKERNNDICTTLSFQVFGNENGEVEQMLIRNILEYDGDTSIYPVRSGPWVSEIKCDFEEKPIKEGKSKTVKGKYKHQKPIRPHMEDFIDIKSEKTKSKKGWLGRCLTCFN